MHRGRPHSGLPRIRLGCPWSSLGAWWPREPRGGYASSRRSGRWGSRGHLTLPRTPDSAATSARLRPALFCRTGVRYRYPRLRRHHVGEYESFALYCLAHTYVEGMSEAGAIPGKRVELAVLGAGVNLFRQLAQ